MIIPLFTRTMRARIQKKLKRAMNNLRAQLKATDEQTRVQCTYPGVIMVVHDEVIMDAPEEGEECPNCGHRGTLMVTEFWPATLVDPECSTGECSNEKCDYTWG